MAQVRDRDRYRVRPIMNGQRLENSMISNQDFDLLARTAWGRARRDGRKAMQGIAEVVLNRQIDGRWAESIRELCGDESLFPFWNPQDSDHGRVRLANLHEPSFRAAHRAVLDALEGSNITNGANDYDMARQRRRRDKRTLVETAEIGRFCFLRT